MNIYDFMDQHMIFSSTCVILAFITSLLAIGSYASRSNKDGDK